MGNVGFSQEWQAKIRLGKMEEEIAIEILGQIR